MPPRNSKGLTPKPQGRKQRNKGGSGSSNIVSQNSRKQKNSVEYTCVFLLNLFMKLYYFNDSNKYYCYLFEFCFFILTNSNTKGEGK